MNVVPPRLQQILFSRVGFELEFIEPCRLTLEGLCCLRRELLRAARLSGLDQDVINSSLPVLFDPPLAADPVARKRYQRPGPSFSILPHEFLARDYRPGERMVLPICFWGQGVQHLGVFAAVLHALGNLGLLAGQGRFRLVAMQSEDAAGQKRVIWQSPAPLQNLAPTLIDARWWLEQEWSAAELLALQFLTPARLLSRGRPLFRADFGAIFPFILRRVSSLAYAHCGVELFDQPGELIAAAARVPSPRNRLRWRDWQRHEGGGRQQDLGGISGSMVLEGRALESLRWILALGSLLNVGKNAAYGAGHYRLLASDREARF